MPLPGHQPGEVRLIAPEALGAAASTMADRAAAPQLWLGLGEVDLTPLTLVLVADAAGFERWSMGRVPGWGAGLTIPSRRVVVIRFDAGSPLQTLQHELAHLALHSRVPTRLPLWFSEGYAALASGEHGRLDALQLNLAVALGRTPGLGQLDAALRGGRGDVAVAYALAADAVAEVGRRHPTRSLEPILARLQQGESFDAALLASTGLDPDGFDERWLLSLRSRHNLGLWFMAGGAWVLVTAVLAAGLSLRRRRDAPRRRALDVGWPVPAPEGPGEGVNGSMTTGLTEDVPLDPGDFGR